jgi:hypothetical protein
MGKVIKLKESHFTLTLRYLLLNATPHFFGGSPTRIFNFPLLHTDSVLRAK